jgi:glutamate/tyrosine decarboxylase-like PLP-dependent enzyme
VFDLDAPARARMWEELRGVIDSYLANTALSGPTQATDGPGAAAFLTEGSQDVAQVLRDAARGLSHGAVDVGHPRYFGTYDGAGSIVAAATDALVSALNPQLALRRTNPFADEVERLLVRDFATRFGAPPSEPVAGVFTSGASEGNFIALQCALAARFPTFAERGVRACPALPRIYASVESHASIIKAARAAGLGSKAVRLVGVDASGALRVDSLMQAIAQDKRKGHLPFAIVGTVGATSCGAIDPIERLAEIASRLSLWLHVDAAWGAIGVLAPSLRTTLPSMARADSITFDAHKVLDMPIATGLFWTRHHSAMRKAFHVTAGYMPSPRDDFFALSPSWSRRALGMRIAVHLRVFGWDAIEKSLDHQVALGRRLREGLRAQGFPLVCESVLPVVAFEPRSSAAIASDIVKRVLPDFWISETKLGSGKRVLRACITSSRTTASDVDALLDRLLAVSA